MKKYILLFILLILNVANAQNELPRVFTYNAKKVFELRNSFLKGDLKDNPAFKKLIREADSYLKLKPMSVTEKEQIPPSKDKHDYVSLAPYWWPNPETSNGLPYIRKDGEKNPEVYKYPDDEYQSKLIEAVNKLALAFYLTDDSKYSVKTAQLLRAWFLDEKTKMNPNLNYGQFIPGINEGRGAGIIDVHGYYKVIDAVGLIQDSKSWANEDITNIKKWFSEFLNWLQTSKNGISESKASNNHGTWYSVQVAAISLYIGKEEFAKQFMTDVLKKRISSQIKEDGTQPYELVRTKSWHYSAFNLTALDYLLKLAENAGIDYWNFVNEEGGSFQKALDYIIPAAVDPNLWQHQQISEITKEELYPLLISAKRKFNSKVYSEWINKIFGKDVIIDIEYLL